MLHRLFSAGSAAVAYKTSQGTSIPLQNTRRNGILAMRRLLTTSLLLLMAFSAGGARASTLAAEDRCWADWSAAAPVVHREALRPAKDVRALLQQDLARKNSQGQLLNITLCEEKGKFVYRLLILRSAGTLDAVTVDARHPFGK